MIEWFKQNHNGGVFLMTYTFRPKGVCSQLMEIDTEGSKITGFKVYGGCDGNLQGISRLIKGMEIDDVIRRLEGIQCGGKPTSCPDQLAKALKELKSAEE